MWETFPTYLKTFLLIGLSLGFSFLIKWLTQKKFKLLEKFFGINLKEKTINLLSWAFFLWCLILGFYLINEFLNPLPRLTSLFNKLIAISFILSLVWVFSQLLINLFTQHIIQKIGVIPSVSIIELLIKIIIFFIGLILVLDILKINVTPFITSLGIAGLAVGLALKDTLENFFSGLHLLMARQIKPGDYIMLDGNLEGFVEDITWRNTLLRHPTNNLIIVPNSKISSSVITNYTLPQPELNILIPVGVSYGSDLKKVEQVTIEVAKEVLKEIQGGIPEFEPFIRYYSFGDSSINFNVVLRVRTYIDRHLIIHEFIKRLHQRYREEGIEIPFPIRTVYLKNVS
ncbi:mechanosensitive ion channel family protein [Thermodesulfobacterium sp. TA1]|uniref:mechanosensitive ion channel family protein n=1 Tax=Thermodesulfobacterium sp. TA1 TaxID=2234087 RepID=UPI001231F64E|nr:mechanosensitive ion channel family protein [Thermodesulfobacterium sp. TA1]QER41607.1 mechanosensitive ion channel family protein [Thermodesulfobacterium sp. TA1]